jgi:tape measure domain-containing protein
MALATGSPRIFHRDSGGNPELALTAQSHDSPIEKNKTMATIGSLKYQITADSTQLNAAMVATKSQLREAAKIMRESVTPAAELQSALDRTQKLYELGVISLEAYGQKVVKLNSSTPETIAQQRAHNSAIADAKAITERNMTAQDHYNASLERLNQLKPHLSQQAYDAELKRLEHTLPQVANQQRLLATALAEAAAITARNLSPQDHYNASLERLNQLKPHLSQQAYDAELKRLEHTLPQVANQQRLLATALAEAAAITARNLSPQDHYNASLERLNQIKPHLSQQAYDAELKRLEQTLPQVVNQQRLLATALAEAAAITARNLSPQDHYNASLERLNQIKPHLSQQAYDAELKRLEQTLPQVVNQQRLLATALAEAAAITARNLSAQDRYAASLARLNQLKPHLSQQAYNAELHRLQMTLPEVAAKEQRRNQLLSEARALTASVESAEEKRLTTLNRIDQMLRKGAISQETYNRAVAREMSQERGAFFTGATQSRHPAIDTAGNDSGGPGNMLLRGGLTQLATIATVGTAVYTAKEIFKLTAAVESAGAAFEVLIGDASRANQMVAQMKSLDKASMLDFNSIAHAGKTLLGYGTAVDTVMPSLDALSQVSMGNREKFQSLALAFGQVQARGRMTAEEVRQMVNAGFNPLQEIARVTGQTLLQVQDRMAEGAISADMVTQALKAAVAEGGRFNGMNEKLGKTGAGALAKTASDLQTLAVSIGSIAMPTAIAGLNTIRETVKMTTFYVDKFGDGLSLIGATLTGNLNTHLDTIQAIKDQAEAARITKEVAEEQLAIEKQIAAINSREAERKSLNQQADWIQGAAMPGDRTADEARGIVNAHKVAEELAQSKRTQFKSERDAYFDEIKNIDEKYQRLMLGEQRYQALQQERKLTLPQQAKILGENEDSMRRSADEKIAAIKRMEADQLAVKEREKAEKEAEKKREQLEKTAHDKRLSMAEDINKKNNPMSGLAARLREIDDLRQRGLIDSSNHSAARTEAITDATNKAGSNTSATAATITRGSVEEYKQRYSSEKQTVDKQLQATAVQTTIAKLQLEQQKITNEKLAAQPQITVAR